jgi:aspartate aminotransferase-like enzyme
VTPAIPHYYALARQLEDIDAGVTLPEGERDKTGVDAWQARFEKHERMKERTLSWASGHGLEPFPGEGFRSATVSCVSAGNLDIGGFVTGLKERGFEISNGYGARLIDLRSGDPDVLGERVAQAAHLVGAEAVQLPNERAVRVDLRP